MVCLNDNTSNQNIIDIVQKKTIHSDEDSLLIHFSALITLLMAE